MTATETIVTNPASPGVVAAWEAAGQPTGKAWVDFAQDYYDANKRGGDGTWNAHLAGALGARAQPEQHVCKIF